MALDSVFNMLIAFFDIAIAVSYIMLFSVEVLADYHASVQLHTLWHWWLRYVYSFAHICFAASVFLITIWDGH